jgi:hypothetical protein
VKEEFSIEEMRTGGTSGFSDIPTLTHLPTSTPNCKHQTLLARFPPIHNSHHHNKLYNFSNQIQNLVAYEKPLYAHFHSADSRIALYTSSKNG